MSAAERAAPVSAAEARDFFDFLKGCPAAILAVSGGPDSTALLWLAGRWRKALNSGPKLVAVTVDHGLRPEAGAEARAVQKLARSLGVPHRTLRWTGRKPKTGLQQAARQARYRLLAAAARKAGAGHVLTAHTLDDQAETVLFRLARGSGVSGLAGMNLQSPMPVAEGQGIALARPLLDIPKSRLIATLKAAGIPYSDDPTNRDPRFARPRLRVGMPALAQEGLTAKRLALLARRVARAEIALYEALNDAQRRLAPSPWPEGKPVTMNAGDFYSLADELQVRLLGRTIDWTGDEGPVELGKLETLCEALVDAIESSLLKLQDSRRFRRTLAGAVVTLDGDQLRVERAPPRRGGASKRP